MKTNIFLIASLLILVGMGAITVSCEKQKTAFRKAQLILDNSNTPKTGDDDDEPIFQGKVRKKIGLATVGGARVETYEYGTNNKIGTQYTYDPGEFTQQVKSGTYYFKVTVPNDSNLYITDTLSIHQNMQVTILVD